MNQSTDITGARCLETEPHEAHPIVGSFRGSCPGIKSAQEGATLLPYVVERVGQHTGFCPGCEQHIPVMFADELYPHATPAAQSCLGDKWSRCEGRQMGFRCQRAPHEEGKHERQPTRASGLWRWDDSEIQPKHPHPHGGSCWTPSRCKALAALAELRTAAVRYDDHEFSTRLDDIEAALGLTQPCPGLTEAQVDQFVTVPCGRRDAHGEHVAPVT